MLADLEVSVPLLRAIPLPCLLGQPWVLWSMQGWDRGGHLPSSQQAYTCQDTRASWGFEDFLGRSKWLDFISKLRSSFERMTPTSHLTVIFQLIVI